MTAPDSSGGVAPLVGGRRSAPPEDLHLESDAFGGMTRWLQRGLSEEERFDMWLIDRRRVAYRDALTRFGVEHP